MTALLLAAGFRISLLLLLLPLIPQAQVMDFVNIHLTVREKVGDHTQLMPHARLNISNVGEVVANENGQYIYTYPVQNQPDPEISVSLLSPEHKLLKPLDGSVLVDPSRAELHIEFLVVNLSEENLEFQKRIDALDARMLRLQREKQLTKQQLYRLNNTLLDTILYFENIRNALQERLAGVEQISEEQREKIGRQQAEIAQLEEKVNALTQE